MRYLERQPAPQLAPWILSYWGFQSDAALPPGERYTVWPDGCTSVGLFRMANGPTMILCVGPRHTAMQPPVFAGGRLWGIRLRPDCVEPVLGVSATSLHGISGPAPEVIAARFATLAQALPVSDDADVVFPALEAWLLRSFPPTELPVPDPRIRSAIGAIVAARGEIAMSAVAGAASTSLRQLQREFPRATGLTLRDFARVRRLREALALRLRGDAGGWSRIAAETGFVDHAHLTREFVALTGIAPSVAARQLARTSHVNVAP